MPHKARHNPFEPVAPAQLAQVYRWHDLALAFVEGRLDALQVIGLPGMGKTTLLSQVRLRLALEGEEPPYTCIPVGGIQDPDQVPVARVTLMDETDRLAPAHLAEILRRIAGLQGRVLLGTHRLHEAALRRAGFTPRTIRLRPVKSPAAAAEILLSRFAANGCDPGDSWVLAPGADRALLRNSRGNVERILQIGYELHEDLGAPGIITPDHIRAAAHRLSRSVTQAAASR